METSYNISASYLNFIAASTKFGVKKCRILSPLPHALSPFIFYVNMFFLKNLNPWNKLKNPHVYVTWSKNTLWLFDIAEF